MLGKTYRERIRHNPWLEKSFDIVGRDLEVHMNQSPILEHSIYNEGLII